MSDLTRYKMGVGALSGGSGIRAWGVEDAEGEWVRAEEAEARIKELEAERNHFAELYEQATGRDGELEARTVDARLRAADELAGAVEGHDEHAMNWDAVLSALTAYREAGK